jgi:hypothetical protein
MPAASETIEAPTAQGKEEPWAEQDEWAEHAFMSLELRERVETQCGTLLDVVHKSAGLSGFESFERELIPALFKLGRLLIALYLCLGQERVEEDGSCARRPGEHKKSPKDRLLGTFFGKVRYWRTYLYCPENGAGRYPLDEKLGLLADGFSLGLLGRAVQVATKMSYEAAGMILASFLGWSPSTTSIEEATLGLGRYSSKWFETAPLPSGDGEILVIQLDSKAVPTATEQELEKRRAKRQKGHKAPSARQRGRARRERLSPKVRRKKGDKSKNGKMATIVVMYTLKRSVEEDGTPILLGPTNRWHYASFAPKRHVVAVARREANRRGFERSSGKLIQIVTDGDEDLACYIRALFPEARHTLDAAHALEYLWKAGGCLFREGSSELLRWVEKHKAHLYEGNIHETVLEVDERIKRIKTGAKRKRLAGYIEYLAKRADMMNYDLLSAEDLELGSGIVEGAVRFVISQRFDEGGMRWIRERAEALLQLRCIELNSHWQQFLDFAHQRLLAESAASGRPSRLLQSQPQPLPTFGLV